MKTFVELIILVILIGAGVLIYSFHVGDPNNPINQELRTGFLKSTITRGVLALNNPGDQRYAYVSPQYNSIIVEVDLAPGIVPGSALKSWLQGMVQDTTGKDIELHQGYDNNIPPKDAFTYTELLSIAKKTRDPLLSAQQNYLHILYLTSSSNAPTNAGLVLTASDMFIFKNVINSLSERDLIRSRIEQSTIMHEWGHLLGLEHTTQPDCIMSETVEVYGNARFQGSNIPTQYCAEAYYQIQSLKKEAKQQ